MLRRFTIRAQLLILAIFLSLLMIGIGAMGLKSTYDSNQALNQVYVQRVVPVGELRNVVAHSGAPTVEVNRATASGVNANTHGEVEPTRTSRIITIPSGDCASQLRR